MASNYLQFFREKWPSSPLQHQQLREISISSIPHSPDQYDPVKVLLHLQPNTNHIYIVFAHSRLAHIETATGAHHYTQSHIFPQIAQRKKLLSPLTLDLPSHLDRALYFTDLCWASRGWGGGRLLGAILITITLHTSILYKLSLMKSQSACTAQPHHSASALVLQPNYSPSQQQIYAICHHSQSAGLTGCFAPY